MNVAAPFLAIPLSLSLVGSVVAAPAAPTEGEAPADTPAVTEPPEAPKEAPKEDPKLEQAMVSYDLGKKAYNAARYEDALEHFQEAATRYASADFQYNIGLCYERLNKPDEAVRAFRTYLRAKPNANDRANVEDRIFSLEEEIAEAANQPPPERPQPDPVPEPVVRPPGRALIITGAALAGVGVAVGLGGTIGFGIPARSRSLDVEDVISGGNPNGLTQEDAQALEDEGRRFETFQIVTGAVGGAVALTGVALLVIGLKKRKEAASSATLTTVAPTWSARSAGLSLQGRF